jgi:hypothetical protein
MTSKFRQELIINSSKFRLLSTWMTLVISRESLQCWNCFAAESGDIPKCLPVSVTLEALWSRQSYVFIRWKRGSTIDGWMRQPHQDYSEVSHQMFRNPKLLIYKKGFDCAVNWQCRWLTLNWVNWWQKMLRKRYKWWPSKPSSFSSQMEMPRK